MLASQKIKCNVNSCMHHKSGNLCSLNAIQVFPCSDANHSDHDSTCYSFQRR
ncbi:MAG TPA: DUF1540 domain-containing protein [Syntrophomonadaceae bacterium]|nr:DUF1540 domain-containing protein [Syntrophomonadaceae bacterium]